MLIELSQHNAANPTAKQKNINMFVACIQLKYTLDRLALVFFFKLFPDFNGLANCSLPYA